jgi:Family of unknown function (DUF5995)
VATESSQAWQAHSIEGVIDRLDAIIADSVRERSRLGYFAALYRGVTITVRDRIRDGYFHDGPLVARLDLTFANRYLEALYHFRSGQRPSRCWQVAFDTAAERRPLVLQHLLLGINAHINLDLGVAAAQTVPEADLPSLLPDFIRINDILAVLLTRVQVILRQISPWLGLLDKVDPTASQALVNFSIDRARDQAWTAARLLACVGPAAAAEEIAVIDRSTALLARLIRDPPGWVLPLGLRLIRVAERQSVGRVTELLGSIATDNATPPTPS